MGAGDIPVGAGTSACRCYEEYLRLVTQSAASLSNGGLPMATVSVGGVEGLRLPDLTVLVNQTAEHARNCRVLNLRAAMVPVR